jgi:hypothetical protein
VQAHKLLKIMHVFTVPHGTLRAEDARSARGLDHFGCPEANHLGRPERITFAAPRWITLAAPERVSLGAPGVDHLGRPVTFPRRSNIHVR